MRRVNAVDSGAGRTYVGPVTDAQEQPEPPYPPPTQQQQQPQQQQPPQAYPPPGGYPPPQGPPAYAAPQTPVYTPPPPGYTPPGAGYYVPGYYVPAPALPPALANAQLASYGSRVLATIVDGLINWTIIGWIVNWALMGRQGPMNGMTLGKQVMGIRVVRGDGAPVSFGFAVVREFLVRFLMFWFFGLLITFFIVPLLDYLWPLWDQQNQTLHDKVVNTYVVNA